MPLITLGQLGYVWGWVLGGCFDEEVALELGQSVEADLFCSFFIAEVAEADAVLARLRHEPCGVRDGLRLLAPGTFYRVFG